MDWAQLVPLGMEWVWSLAGAACLAAAGAMALRPGTFERWEARLEAEGGRRSDRAAALILGACLPLLCAAFKLAQFRRFELMWDSGVLANLAWNIAHGYGPHSSVIADRSYLSVHFAFIVGLFAPLLRLGFGTGLLAAAHGLAVGVSLWAAYLLGARVGGRRSLGWLLALLAWSHPFFHDIEGSVLDNSIYILPLCLWGLLAWERGNRRWAALCAALLLTARETMPLLLFGFALYSGLKASNRRERLRAAAGMAACAACWLAVWALMRSARADWQALDPWKLFSALGGSPGELFGRAATRPWEFAAALVFPPEKALRALGVLLELGFLPLAAGKALVPALVIWLPQQLADAGVMYHRLIGHNAVYIFGPLLWASAYGLKRITGRPGARAQAAVCGLLLVSGIGFLRGARFLLPPGMNPSLWLEAGPRAMAHVPAGASLWCDEFFLPHLALRRHVKSLMGNADPYFEPGLFVPDRVLLSTHWLRTADAERRDAVLGTLKEGRFVELLREGDLVVLGNPATLGKEGGEPKPLGSMRGSRAGRGLGVPDAQEQEEADQRERSQEHRP
ncbi:MAG: DUF2079 domain-containing protein [Elusimicrobiota bacterium]